MTLNCFFINLKNSKHMKFNENDLRNAILSCNKERINQLYCDICNEVDAIEKKRQMVAITLRTLKVAEFDGTDDFKKLQALDSDLLGTIKAYKDLQRRAFNAYTSANSDEANSLTSKEREIIASITSKWK